MDPNFHLIKQVNPSKSAGKIKECFAKLTLSSSRKKIRPNMEPDPSASSTVRRLFDDFLTDDESDTEANELNRIFLTKTTARTTDSKKPAEHRRSKSFSQRLEVSDSDETNCSLEIDEKCEEMHSEMEKLQISPTQSQKRQSSQPLFTDSQPTTTDVPVPIQQISSRLSSLDIQGKEGEDRKPSSVEADAALEQILLKQKLMKDAGEPRRVSVYSINSSLTDTLEDSDVVIISESDSESECSYPVSSIHDSNYIEPCTPSGSMAARLDAFFDNIPSLESNQGPELLLPQSEASPIIEENSIEVDQTFLDESIEICESSEEDKGQAASPHKTSSPRAPLRQSMVQNIASPSPRRSPRKHPSSLPKTPQKPLPATPAAPSMQPEKIASPSPRKMLQTPEKPRETATPKATTKIPLKSLSPSPLPSQPPVPSPTPLQDLPPSSDSESERSFDSYRIEKINISAKIKIKVQISDASSPVITTSSSSTNTPRITQSTEPDSPPTPLPEEQLAEEEVLTPENLRHRTIRAPHISAIDIIVLDTPPAPQTVNEIDEAAQKLLNQIYGDEWKTPDVMKTLKNASMNTSRIPIPSKISEEDVMDFSKFHNSIRSDLESTRLPNVPKSETKTPGSIFKVPFTDRKVVRSKQVEEKKCISERKVTAKGRTVTSRIPKLYDSDSSDQNSDLNASSDDTWTDIFSYSSDDGTATATPTTRVTKKKKNSSKGKLIYLDLSSEIVKVQDENENPNANNDANFQDRLKKLLETCKASDKPKIEATPKQPTKTKRKLFTPRFGDENDASPIKPDVVFNYQENDSINSVTLKAPLPAMFEPINKQLEAVKSGKPIFAIKTPKSISKKNKENSAKKMESPGVTPLKTAKNSTTNKSEIVVLQDTPSNKYGFLQSLDVTVSKMFCHPDALIYKEKFKLKKEELAEKLNEIFKERVFENKLDVPLMWNKKLISTAGRCRCSKKLGKRLARIELSEKVLTSADRLRCTLIHELCHAANWIYNGETGHGEMWKKWANRANAVFPELPKIERCHNYEIDYKYTYKCTLCAAKSHAHSKSKKVENIRCSYCHGAIEIFLNKKDKDGNVMPTPVKEPTGFAKFVKDNYKKHKTPDRKHADVMKILSNEFATMKM